MHLRLLVSGLCLSIGFCVNDVYLLLLLTTKKARVAIQEVHFLPFNPTDKRTALTYIDSEGKMHRVSKGAPEQVR